MRKIAVFTGNRAEYALLHPIIKAIAARKDLEYYLIVSGSHLERIFGGTILEIKRHGLKIYRKIKIDSPQDSLYSTANSIGEGVSKIAKVLKQLRPDILLVYGDRSETFAAAIAASQMGIPTAHVEGGDITEGGTLDDSVRHAITKLSHLHFATNPESARRIRKMGEESWRVFNVGFPAIDMIAAGDYASPTELKKLYGIDFKKPVIVFTQHSVATECDQAVAQLRPCLKALETLADQGCQIIITYPNNDAGGKRMIKVLMRWSAARPHVTLVRCLGRYNYHGIMHHVGHGRARGVCVGNSSSGIKETPALGCPAVNIGLRQKGRLRAKNVIDITEYDGRKILNAVRKSLFDEKFRAVCRNCNNPYGRGNSGKKIVGILARIKLGPTLIKKRTVL